MAEKVREHQREIEMLERRIKKLGDLLDTTEAQLRQIARAKGVDPGLASIYRTVQGLDEDEENFARKKEMLSLIFDANVDLQRKIKGGS